MITDAEESWLALRGWRKHVATSYITVCDYCAHARVGWYREGTPNTYTNYACEDCVVKADRDRKR